MKLHQSVKRTISLLLFAFSAVASAQNCSELNGNQIKDIVKLDNDDFVFLTDNFKITKVDSDFDTIWHQDHLDTTGNRLNKLQPTFDGGFIAAGSGPDGNLYKLNSLGDTAWAKTVQIFWGPFGGFSIRDLIQTKDSGYAFVAIFGHQFANSMLVKTNKFGDTLWTKIDFLPAYNSLDKQAKSIKENSNGDLVVSGFVTLSPPSNGEFSFLYTFNANGDSLWAKTYYDYNFNGFEIDGNQDFIIAGQAKNASNAMEPVILKTNSLGDTLWTRRVPSKRLNCVALVNGGYAFVGAKEQLSNFTSSYLLKTDVNGDSLWSKVYQADSTDRELELIYTLGNDDYLLLGSKAPFQSNFLRMDYRIQVDSLGNCGSVGFEELGNQSITLSPNPNTGYFSIQIDPSQLGSVYGIFDNLGRLIEQGVITEQTQDFDLSGQLRGMYTIKVSNQGEMKVRKVIIQ